MLILVKFIILFFLFFPLLDLPGIAWGAPKGKLVIAQGGDISTLDPHRITDSYTWCAYRYVYDNLIRRVFKDGTVQHFPMLATSWQTIDDTTWVFHLRKGVKFHNGQDFTAEDVKYTIERMLNPATKSGWRSNLFFIDRVVIVDPYTVKIFTKGPAPLMVINLGYGVGIVPHKYFQEKGEAYVALHPVGTGPFKFVRWVKDEEVVYEANENYWGGYPKIKTLILKPIPEAGTRVAALLGGDVDIAKNIPSHLIPMINKSGKAKAVVVPDAKGITGILDTLKKGPLQDKRVRQAINYAVDREQIIKTVLEGYGKALGTPLSEAIFGYDPNIKPYPYDPDKAKALLKEAGYGDGFALNYATPSGRYDKDREFAEAIAGQLAKVGIKVKVRVYEWGNYHEGTRSGTLGDMYIMGQSSNFDASPIYRRILDSRSQPQARWVNEEFDGILDRADHTIDPKKRKDFLRQAGNLVHEEAPGLFLWQGVNVYGMSNRVQNWSPTPCESTAIYMYEASVKD